MDCGMEAKFANDLYEYSLTFKNHAFCEEQEIRIIHTPKISTIYDENQEPRSKLLGMFY
jgi:hypothetical protein